METTDAAFSQLVISEASANCMINSIATSTVGKIILNKEKLSAMFGGQLDDTDFDSTSIAKELPIFNKVDANTPIKLELSMQHVNVLFGKYDTDVTLSYTAQLAFKNDKTDDVILYDEIRMLTTMKMEVTGDKMKAKFLNHKLDIDKTAPKKTKPMLDNLNLTEKEYREFLTTYSFSLNNKKKWMNEIFADGYDFPM